jgi:hypothetical protein
MPIQQLSANFGYFFNLTTIFYEFCCLLLLLSSIISTRCSCLLLLNILNYICKIQFYYEIPNQKPGSNFNVFFIFLSKFTGSGK